MPDLVVIEHTQSIAYEEDGTPQEHLSISVRFTYEAFSSGWVRENLRGRGGPTDFLVMTAIANHARPLQGDDLRLLVSLGVATEADEGRLYARVTDVGLADELGCGRDTVKNAAQRLAGKELIRICEREREQVRELLDEGYSADEIELGVGAHLRRGSE